MNMYQYLHVHSTVRGFTTPIVWWDEFAYIDYNDVIYKSASPAQSRAEEEARKMGKPTFKSITTTPSDLDSKKGKYCKGFMDKAAQFVESIYDMNEAELSNYMMINSKNDFVHIQFSYKELGRDQKWYNKQLRALDNDLKTFKREILLHWTKTSDSSVFEEENIDIIEKYKLTKYNPMPLLNKFYTLNVFIPFSPKKQYLIGVDTAGGLDNDSSTIVVTDPVTLKPIAYFAHNKIDTDEFYNLIVYLMRAYFPKSILCIERNSYGLTIIQRLLKTDLKSQVFARNITNSDREKLTDVKSQSLKKSDSETIEYGINTTPFTRNYMIELLKSEVINNPEVFGIDRIIQEIRTLEYKKNGKIEHGSGHHDDVLMAYLFTRLAMSLTEDYSKYRKIESSDSAATLHIISSMNNSKFDKINDMFKDFDKYEQLNNNNNLGNESNNQMGGFASIMSLNK